VDLARRLGDRGAVDGDETRADGLLRLGPRGGEPAAYQLGVEAPSRGWQRSDLVEHRELGREDLVRVLEAGDPIVDRDRTELLELRTQLRQRVVGHGVATGRLAHEPVAFFAVAFFAVAFFAVAFFAVAFFAVDFFAVDFLAAPEPSELA
jgi:hypothetical protein